MISEFVNPYSEFLPMCDLHQLIWWCLHTEGFGCVYTNWFGEAYTDWFNVVLIVAPVLSCCSSLICSHLLPLPFLTIPRVSSSSLLRDLGLVRREVSVEFGTYAKFYSRRNFCRVHLTPPPQPPHTPPSSPHLGPSVLNDVYFYQIRIFLQWLEKSFNKCRCVFLCWPNVMVQTSCELSMSSWAPLSLFKWIYLELD